MKGKAVRVREALRLDRIYGQYASVRKVEFRHQGCSYIVFLTMEDEYSVLVNGRFVSKPPKAVLRMARREMALQDVETVHAL